MYRNNWGQPHFGVFLAAVVLISSFQLTSRAFTTVINAPPQAVPVSIGSDTQLNLFSGGVAANGFAAGASAGTSTNVEVNVQGGQIQANAHGYAGSTVNISSGSIGSTYRVHDDSVLNISGGTVGINLQALTGSEVNLSAGSIGNNFSSAVGSIVNIMGGSIGTGFETFGTVNISGGTINSSINSSFIARSGSVVNVSGGSFPNGVTLGNGSTFNISGGTLGSQLTTNQVFVAVGGSHANITGGRFPNRSSFNVGSNISMAGGTYGDVAILSGTTMILGGDFFLNGAPIGTTANVDLPDLWTLSGTFANGTPFVFSNEEDNLAGTVLERDFIRDGFLSLSVVPLPAIGPATINVPADPMPIGLRNGQTLNVGAGASVPVNFTAGAGSTAVVNGGAIGANFEAYDAQVEVVNGSIGERFDAFGNTTVNLYDAGLISDNFEMFGGSTLNAMGGFVSRQLQVYSGATVNASGARIYSETTVHAGGEFNLSGGTVGFRLTVEALANFNIFGGEFHLDGVPMNVVGSAPVNISNGAVLSGTLADGTPFVFQKPEGSFYGDALADGTITLHAQALPPIGPAVITMPNDPAPLGIRAGQKLIVNSGTTREFFTAGKGSQVEINGGSVNFFETVDANVKVEGGMVSGIRAYDESAITIDGGEVDYLDLRGNSTADIAAGHMFDGRLAVFPGSELHLFGSEFYLDDVLIPNLDDLGDTLVVTTRGTARLSGYLTDGSFISLYLTEQLTTGDYFDAAATLRLTIADSLPPDNTVPEPTAVVLVSFAGLFLTGRRAFARPMLH